MNDQLQTRFDHWYPRVAGAFMGCRIGDAMGMPWEIIDRDEILRLTGGQGLTGFQDYPRRFFGGVRKLKLGDYTDDYQLTAAIARAMIASHGFSLEEIAREHVREMYRTTAGWGGSTKQSIKVVAEWFESMGKRGRRFDSPAKVSKQGKGTGNGVVMKVSPVPIWNAIRAGAFGEAWNTREQVMQLGGLTHVNPLASIAAVAVARLEEIFFQESNPKMDDEKWAFEVLREIARATGAVARAHRIDIIEWTTRANKLLDFDLLFGNLQVLARTVGTSCFALESAVFCIAVALRHPNDFRAAMLEALNADGERSDRDTNCAIVGAMIGAHVGIEGIPLEWRNFYPDFAETEELARAFTTAAVTP